jgi:hypothetical protein
MRVQKTQGTIRGQAIAGNRVVALGWNMPKSEITPRDVLGFAIERTRRRDGEVAFLMGMKTFKSVTRAPGPGVKVSSRGHPFEGLQWCDWSVSPGATAPTPRGHKAPMPSAR